MRFINADCSRATIKDGILTIPTDIGYAVTARLDPVIFVDEILEDGGAPKLSLAGLHLGKTGTVQLEQDSSTVHSQSQLNKYLGSNNYIPESWLYDDFMIGFIYEDPGRGNPDNFKWMFQFRVLDKIINSSMVFADGIDIECPVSTYSWFEHGTYHGRMIVDRNDLDIAVQSVPGRVRVIGKTCGGHPVGDTSLIPTDCDVVSVGFDIFKNRWWFQFLGAGEKIGERVVVREIIADVHMAANTDRNPNKPKVTEHIKRDDIASLTIKAGIATVLGK